VFACAVLTCVVAPPVRGASEINDGGGCNGGRHLAADEPSASSTSGETTSSSGETEPTETTTTGTGACGDGVVEPGEACDDDNTVDEDECPSGPKGRCQAKAKCGDGIVWAGEEVCGDGNTDDDDGCPSGEGACAAMAKCGDVFVAAVHHDRSLIFCMFGATCLHLSSDEIDASTSRETTSSSGETEPTTPPGECGDGVT